MPDVDEKLKSRFKEICHELSILYARNDSYRTATQTMVLWARLNEVQKTLRRSAFDDTLYILSVINRPGVRQCKDLAKRAIPRCTSIDQINQIFPYVPKTRKDILRTLFHKVVKLAKDKEELASWV